MKINRWIRKISFAIGIGIVFFIGLWLLNETTTFQSIVFAILFTLLIFLMDRMTDRETKCLKCGEKIE
jgi:membrane protein implicated in regulation of membrane protease activity